MELFVNVNGQLVASSQPVINAGNRSFRYGDGIFETIRIANGKIQFFERHFQRLITSMEAIKLETSPGFTPDFVKNEIEKLAKENKVSGGARIRLTVFRKEGGFYSPHSNSSEFIIECEPVQQSIYELNEKGYNIDIFPDYKKTMNRLSNIKSNNALLFVLAGIHRRKNNLDECIILNTNFSIAESISSNIFAVKNGVLYTPPITESCVDGIMRHQIIELARNNKIAVYEVPLAMNVLLNSDEIFLTNAISGIRWIAAYKAKRYVNTMAKFLTEKLNESLIS